MQSGEPVQFAGDGVQDVLLQNMAPGHTEYFKLKEFEKWYDLPLKQVIKLSREGWPR